MRGEKVGSLGADEHELGATLREWAVLTKSYFDEEKDSPFVYREETNVSLLVAAAWKTGCPAISEFQHKHRKKGKRDRIVDASVLTGPIGSRTEWFIEAKMCWPVIHEYSKLTVEMRKSVRAAWNQLNKLELGSTPINYLSNT